MKLLHKDQRGVGQLGLILALVVVLALGGVGYFVYSKNKDKGADSGLSKADRSLVQEAIKNAKCDYDDKDLCKFFAGYQVPQDITVNTTTESDGKTSTMLIKADGENKSHFKMTGEVEYEVITIDGTTYTKAANGTWWKQTAKNNAASDLEGEAKVDFEEPKTTTEDKSKYVKEGKEKCGSLMCFKYKLTADGTTTYMWFDDKDYLLRRSLVEMEGGKTDSSYSYDNVTVSVPSPVKDLAENQYLMPGQSEPTTIPSAPGGGDGPSEEELRQLMEQYQ